jgi:diguanylate cyclase (GGDEF)-like protein
LARVRRSESFVAVFFLDLDRFKAINDTRGHLVGDRVLRLVGNRLRLAVRPADTVARLGGDEFIIICTDLRHEHEAQVIADRILHALGHPLDVEGGEGEMVVTASIGIALGRAGDQPDDVLREADAAMYKAKARDHLDHSHAELFEGHDR